MAEPVEDKSMMLWSFRERGLVSREIAISVAEMVIKEAYGEEEFQRQQPLEISEQPDRWLIEGSGKYDYDCVTENETVDGRVIIEIQKTNCRILRLIQMVDFAQR